MPTLSTIKGRMPVVFQHRYVDSYWIDWANELLEELSGEGLMMHELHFDSGVVVSEKVWIDKPSGLRTINKIYEPGAEDQKYRYRIVNDRIKLLDVEIEEDDDADSIATFSAYATTSVTVDIDDAEEDDYEDYLLVITAGTWANRTYLIKGNDASAGGTCKLYFLHPLSVAMDGTRVTAGYLVSKEYYLMLDYTGTYEAVTAIGDEMPIDDDYERRITKAWFLWKCEEQAMATSKETTYREGQYRKVVKKIKAEVRGSLGGPIQPRYSPGWDQHPGNFNFYDDEEWESDE